MVKTRVEHNKETFLWFDHNYKTSKLILPVLIYNGSSSRLFSVKGYSEFGMAGVKL